MECTLRVARDPGGPERPDLDETERAGFSKDEILEMMGVAGSWSFQTTVASALDAGRRDG